MKTNVYMISWIHLVLGMGSGCQHYSMNSLLTVIL